MQLAPIFPLALGMTINKDGINEEELSVINNFSNNLENNFGNVSTVSKSVLESVPILKKFILDNIKDYFNKTINPENKELEIYITHSWINYTEKGQHHHSHHHPNSVISGVYYLKADNKFDNIRFANPNKTNSLIKIVPESWNSFNAEDWVVPVNTNQLVLFPSSLWHEVPASINEDVRISLAFNTFVRGRIGDLKNTDCVIIQ